MGGARQFGKKVAGWTVASLGAVVGFLGLVQISQASPPTFSLDSGNYWPKDWAGFVGIVLFALVLLVASLVALHNRRRAGFAFLVSAPILAFCCAFASAGDLEWHSDGGGYFESPFISTALWLALLFFAPLALTVLFRRNKRRAALVFLISAAIVTPVFIRSPWTPSFLPLLTGWLALFVAPGLLWLLIDKYGWPPLRVPRERTPGKRVASFWAVFLVIVGLDVVMSFASSAMRSSLWGPDCWSKQPFVHSLSPRHTVFTARVIFVGPFPPGQISRPEHSWEFCRYTVGRLGNWHR